MIVEKCSLILKRDVVNNKSYSSNYSFISANKSKYFKIILLWLYYKKIWKGNDNYTLYFGNLQQTHLILRNTSFLKKDFSTPFHADLLTFQYI